MNGCGASAKSVEIDAIRNRRPIRWRRAAMRTSLTCRDDLCLSWALVSWHSAYPMRPVASLGGEADRAAGNGAIRDHSAPGTTAWTFDTTAST